MPRKPNLAALAATFAASAQRQFGELESAMRSAQASLAGLQKTLHVAVPSGGSRTIKGSRSHPSIFLAAGAASLGGFFSSQIVSNGGGLLGDLFGGDFSDLTSAGSDTGGSFQQSATQFAAKLFDASLRGQRIR
jgi:hypothetical protein